MITKFIINELSYHKKSVITIKNRDNSCGFKAIALAKFYADENDPKIKKLASQNRKKRFDNLAISLAASCNLDINQPLKYQELEILQNYLIGYKLVVLDAKDKENFIFLGANEGKKLYIEYISSANESTGHYNFISNIRGWFGKYFYCKNCIKAYNTKNSHLCPNHCRSCHSINCENSETNLLTCVGCCREFKNYACYVRHKTNKLCDTLKKCKICSCIYYQSARKTHSCYQYYCNMCRMTFEETPHHCFLRPLNNEKLKKQDNELKYIISYDIETLIQKQENFEHHSADLLIAQISCNNCYPSQNFCQFCLNFEKVFFGEKCIKEFNNYVINILSPQASCHKAKLFVIAHNAKTYDHHFIITDLFERNLSDMSIICNGRKVVKMQFGNVIYLDSYSLFQCALNQLPKAFDLSLEIKKGFFPHNFHSLENLDYSGSIPQISYFETDFMKPVNSTELMFWHEKMKTSSYLYNFKEELISYCRQDVAILHNSIQKFRFLFWKITGLDPISRNFTLASIGLEVFRSQFLKPNTIGVTPLTNYGEYRKSSQIAHSYFDWLELKMAIKIKREQKIGIYWVDGYCKDTNTIFEFYGCKWHFCEKCNCGSLKEQEEEKTKQTNRKNYYLEKKFRFEEIKECQLNEPTLPANQPFPKMKQFLKSRLSFYKALKKDGHCNQGF